MFVTFIKTVWLFQSKNIVSTLKLVCQVLEIGSFVEMWMDLETVIQSEVRKRKTNIVY